MNDFKDYIGRENAMQTLGKENWDLEDAIESFLKRRGISTDTRRRSSSQVDGYQIGKKGSNILLEI